MTTRLVFGTLVTIVLLGVTHEWTATPVGPVRLALLQTQAARGNADAQVDLGIADATPRRDARADAQAVHWFRQAAEQGSAEGQHRLAACYFVGFGVPKDFALAYVWSALAEDHATGTLQHDAATLRTYAADKLTPAQRADADLRVREWQTVRQKSAQSEHEGGMVSEPRHVSARQPG